MAADRYVKIVLTVIAVALVAIAARPLLPDLDAFRPDPAMAQTATPKHEVTVPKSWGKMIDYGNGNLLLEAPDGSLRVVDVEGKAPEYPRVKVLIRWQ
jgi:hypothetical protein